MSVTFNPFTGNLDFNDTTKAAGSDTQVQFNDGGKLGGDSGLVFNKTTNKLTAGGDVELNDGGSFTTTLQTVTPTANRTISFPDATGTVGLVSGSSQQLVYNNAGAYAGVSTMTFDGTSVTLAGRLINSYTSLASSPAKVFTGTWFTGGTSTTTKPHFLIEPSGATSTAWSTSGTGLGVNAASGFAGRLLDLQLNGTSRVVVTGAGSVGVGTASPASNLHVQGTDAYQYLQSGTVNVAAVWFGDTDANGQGRIEYLNSNDNMRFFVNAAERFRCDSSGRLLVGTTSDAGGALLQVNGDRVRIATAKTPVSATATGTAGEICWDADYIYVCTATNTWKRSAISTWP